MTDPATPRPRLGPLPVIAATLAAFLATLTFLAVRVRTGHDPALGAMAASAPAPPVRHVLVRRLVERRVVISIKPAPQDGSAPVTNGTAPQIAASTSAPTAAAPAPAPAPPPVATRSS